MVEFFWRKFLASGAVKVGAAAFSVIALGACGGTSKTPKAYLTNEGPVAYGANGLAAPAVYTVAPRVPRSMGSPIIAMAETPVTPRPVLPSLDTPVGAHPQFPSRGLREPLTMGLNPDLTNSRPLTVEGLDPRQPLPIEQKVYDGVFAKYGEDKPYLHHEGDSVAITVKDQPEFCGTAVIERDGKFRMPGTEDFIAARGRDATQIEHLIARTIRPYVRLAPVVRVVTARGAGGYYYVLGGVKNQGRFPIGLKPLSLSEAVFRANSAPLENRDLDSEANAPARTNFALAERAALERVMLITPHPTAPQAAVYNVASALYGGVSGQNPPVLDGQIIVVGESDNLRLEEYIRAALARDNQRAPLLKTYDPTAPHLDSHLLDVYGESVLPQ
jgi:protein involved in polysaccharide export with SLBB domain